MSGAIDAACEKAGVIPDAFLSAHAHNYQRYTRRTNGRQIPYVVAGTGGIAQRHRARDRRAAGVRATALGDDRPLSDDGRNPVPGAE